MAWPALGRDGVTEDATKPGRAGLGKSGDADSVPGSGRCMGNRPGNSGSRWGGQGIWDFTLIGMGSCTKREGIKSIYLANTL